VALLLAANVQLRPLAVPVKGDVVGALVELVQLAEVVVLDVPGAVDVEEAEGDLVLGVGFQEEVLKDAPVGDAQSSMALVVGDAEEDRVLLSLDFVLRQKFLSVRLQSQRQRKRRTKRRRVLSNSHSLPS
jgi:hypothetical protein